MWFEEDAVVLGEVHDSDGTPTFAMRAHDSRYSGDDADSALTFERGDEVVVTLLNVSSEPQLTGNKAKNALHVLTEEGWTDVRGTREDTFYPIPDDGVLHPPGKGFEWRFTMTENGVIEDHLNAEVLEVCPALSRGRYRFVFWGVAGGGAIAVEFDYDG